MTALAGWYPDPERPDYERWWDGLGWRDEVTAVRPIAPKIASAAHSRRDPDTAVALELVWLAALIPIRFLYWLFRCVLAGLFWLLWLI